MTIDYDNYVWFDGSGRYEFVHSGIASPAITLNPKYGEPTEARIKALQSLSRCDYSDTARRAIEWVGLNDEDAEVKRAAQVIMELWQPRVNDGDEL